MSEEKEVAVEETPKKEAPKKKAPKKKRAPRKKKAVAKKPEVTPEPTPDPYPVPKGLPVHIRDNYKRVAMHFGGNLTDFKALLYPHLNDNAYSFRVEGKKGRFFAHFRTRGALGPATMYGSLKNKNALTADVIQALREGAASFRDIRNHFRTRSPFNPADHEIADALRFFEAQHLIDFGDVIGFDA